MPWLIRNLISVRFISVCQFVPVHMCKWDLSGRLISVLAQYIRACEGSIWLKYVAYIYMPPRHV